MMIYPGHLLLIDVVVALQKEEENGDGNGSDDVDDVDGYPSFSLLFFVLLCFIIIFFMLSKDFFFLTEINVEGNAAVCQCCRC